MVNTFYYNGDLYTRRTEADQMKGYLISSALSGALYKSMTMSGIPFNKQLAKELPNNIHYKQPLENAIKISGLEKYGVSLIEAQNHLTIPNEYRLGKNACFDPATNKVIVNTDKIAIAAYHELGHAMNALKGGFPKILQKMRRPGFVIAGLMEYFAVFSRTKPKEAQKTFTDRIEDNCGKIAFAAMLPMVAEEALASHRGLKLAKQAGLKEPFLNNMKKFLSKALLTYGARAAVGGLAVWASRKIMDHYTFPQKVDSDMYNLFG